MVSLGASRTDASSGTFDLEAFKGVDVSQVGDTTLRAAQKALATVVNDVGFREAVFRLARMAVAAMMAHYCARSPVSPLPVAIQSFP